MHTIQQATAEHVQEIVALWTKLMNIHKDIEADYFSETNNHIEDYKSEIENFINQDSNQLRVYVALKDNKVIGYVTAQLCLFNYSNYNNNSQCTIYDIMIDSDYQNLGIGKAFLEEVKSWSQSKGIQAIQLNVFSKNEVAHAYFKKQGFESLYSLLELKM